MVKAATPGELADALGSTLLEPFLELARYQERGALLPFLKHLQAAQVSACRSLSASQVLWPFP